MLQEPFQYFPCVTVYADRAIFDHFRADGRAAVEACVDGHGILRSHGPEGVLDDDRRVASDAQFKEQHVLSLVRFQESRIVRRGCMPSCVLHKGVVRAQVHCRGTPGFRVGREQIVRQAHRELPILRHLKDAVFILNEALSLHGEHRPVLVIPGSVAAPLCVLKEAVIALRVKQPGLVKTRAPELMIHVGRDNEIVLILYQSQQIGIDRLRRVDVAVKLDVPRPPGPAGLAVREGIEAAGIHVRDAEALDEIEENLLEALAAVGQPGGRGEARSGPDHNGVRGFQFLPEAGDVFFPASRSLTQRITEAAHGGKALADGIGIPVWSVIETSAHKCTCPCR